MGGDASDIIAMDVLPFYKYADNGYLADFNEIISKDTSFIAEDYFSNI
ncbi:MAG: hypothetical protein ACK5LT_06125 [Lachnospirales bacterium]